MQLFSNYYRLTKPGIVYGNAIHIIGGALLAWQLGIKLPAFVGVLIGTSLVIASACVANNYIDRGVDVKMARTKKRPSVTGKIPVQDGLLFAATLLLAGFGLLVWLTNTLVVLIGLVAYVIYVVIYAVAKRTTVHSTLIGSIPGALPAMAGYVAMSGLIDLAAWLIFLLIFIWQMPHFYAISIFRKADYAAAELPVLGVMAPFKQVRLISLAYIGLYILVAIAMYYYRVIGIFPASLMVGLGLYWLLSSFNVTDGQVAWARHVFSTSLIITLAFPVVAALNIVFGA